MSAKKKLKTGAARRGETPTPPVSRWPEEFAPPRQTVLVLLCLLGWTLIFGMLALGNDLLGLKQACMIIAGARLEPILGLASMQSADLAAVLLALFVAIGFGYIHVSVGLAALLAVRPWLDGFVYEADNIYFLWATMYLLVVWAVRQLRRPQAIRGGVPLGILALFFFIMVLSATRAIQFNTTYLESLFWACYGALFFLAMNATRTRAAQIIVLFGFFVGMAGQALYAYPYLAYILPWMRDYMAEDPRRLAAYFPGLTEFTPEVARRMNLNRASASMVFPNALAALLILGIPGCLACALSAGRAARAPDNTAEPNTRFRNIVPWVLPLFSAVCLPVFFFGQLALDYRLGGPPWFGNQANLVLLAVGCAAIVSTVFLLTARKCGLARAALLLATVASTLLLPVMLGALWITYSRGAMLALAAALAMGALVYPGGLGDIARRRLARRSNRMTATAATVGLLLILIVACAVLIRTGTVVAATDASAPSEPSTVVTGEGINVEVHDLINPASFRLRLGYWRVALRIATDYWLTGVGPGNFKFVYPTYQHLGAGDVQNAHNAVLHMWCETGIFGMLALAGFWVYILFQATGNLRHAVGACRWLPWGLFTGLLAFLLHALLDINLSHPSLMMFAMVAAGLLIRFGSADAPALPSVRRTRTVAVSLMLFAALVSGMALRPFLQYLATNGGKFINVDDRDMLDTRFRAATYFLAEGADWARDGKTGPPPVLPIRAVVSLHADRATLFESGRIFAPDPVRGTMAPVSPQDPIPPDALFQMVRPWHAHAVTFEIVVDWLRELERIDARFPYVPENAMRIGRGYKLLVEQTLKDQADRRQFHLDRMLHWAREAVRRSPVHKDMYQNLAWSEWLYGTHASGQASLDHFEAALAAFDRAKRLAPMVPDFYFAHAHALTALGEAYTNAGRPEKGRTYAAEAQRVEAAGRQIQQARVQLGLN